MRSFLFVVSLVLLFTMVPSTQSYAAGSSGPRTITVIGCALDSDLCYVYVSGAPVGPSQCNTVSLRWAMSASPGGKQALAQLTAAFFAGNLVNFYVGDTCVGGNPTFGYYEVFK